MNATLREPLSRERSEVPDVVSDHGAVLAARDLKDNQVAASDQVRSIGHRFNVEATPSKENGDLRRQLFVKKALHSPSARLPAATAAMPRSYSASLNSISRSISSVYSP